MLFRSIFIACLIICLFTLVGALVIAQQTEKPADKKFSVRIIADEDELEQRVGSYLKRELRELGDVEITNNFVNDGHLIYSCFF